MLPNRKIKKIGLLAIFFVLMGSDIRADHKRTIQGNPLNAKKGDWISLFDGKTLQGWHLFNRTGEPNNWKVEDGALVCLGFNGPSGAGDLVSDRAFENFELTWQWKVDKGSNSGMYYHVVEDPKYKRPAETAPEYQLIDDIGYPGKLEEWQKTGADYAMYPPDKNKILNPAGIWNTSRILFNKGRVEYWLNGKLTVKFKAWSKDWLERKAAEKWKDFPDYGMAKAGAIALQDHKSKTYFKDIRIKEL